METICFVRLYNGVFYCFYVERGEGLVYRKFIDGRFGPPELILSHAQEWFTISLSDEGNIFLFCQEKNGTILLFTQSENGFASQPILRNQTKEVYQILISAIVADNCLHLVYNSPVPEEKSQFLVSQMRGKQGEWAQANRFDQIYGMNGSSFQLQTITPNHGILFYQQKSQEANLSYRELTAFALGGIHNITTSLLPILSYSCLTTQNAIHVVYVVRTLFANQLYYRQKTDGAFCSPILIWEAQRIEDSALFIIEDTLYVAYRNNGQMVLCHSKDFGKTFEKPNRYANKLAGQVKKAKFISAIPLEESKFFVREVFVDANCPWEIQMLPQLFSNFFYYATQKVAPIPKPQEIPPTLPQPLPPPLPKKADPFDVFNVPTKEQLAQQQKMKQAQNALASHQEKRESQPNVASLSAYSKQNLKSYDPFAMFIHPDKQNDSSYFGANDGSPSVKVFQSKIERLQEKNDNLKEENQMKERRIKELETKISLLAQAKLPEQKNDEKKQEMREEKKEVNKEVIKEEIKEQIKKEVKKEVKKEIKEENKEI